MNTPSPDHHAQLRLEETQESAVLRVSGSWTVAHLMEAERAKKISVSPSSKTLNVDGSTLEELDTTGAWLLLQQVKGAINDQGSVHWQGFSEAHEKILALVRRITPTDATDGKAGYLHLLFAGFGKASIRFLQEAAALIQFFGRLSATFGTTVTHPARLRLKSVIYHMNDIGIRATPIVMLMAFLISVVLGYQGATQLAKFGATVFTINLVAISILREMGVLITAIMVAGRSSSAFAAQIGVMKMNDEVAALRTLGLDPFELLVLPRMIAIVLMLPVLTFLADLAGLAGTFFMANTLLDMSMLECAERLKGAINSHTFYIGLLKAPVFAMLIGMVGCLQGLQVKNSATELGARTTQAVVQSIFLVLLADALFSVFFTMAGL